MPTPNKFLLVVGLLVGYSAKTWKLLRTCCLRLQLKRLRKFFKQCCKVYIIPVRHDTIYVGHTGLTYSSQHFSRISYIQAKSCKAKLVKVFTSEYWLFAALLNFDALAPWTRCYFWVKGLYKRFNFNLAPRVDMPTFLIDAQINKREASMDCLAMAPICASVSWSGTRKYFLNKNFGPR